MVIATLLRLCGHGEHDDAGYVDPALKASPIGRDCLKVAEGQLLENNWADASRLAAWRLEAVRTVEDTVAKVQREPAPDPYRQDWCALASRHLAEACEPAEGAGQEVTANPSGRLK